MHEKIAKITGGTSHSPDSTLHEEVGMHHKELGEFEKKALEGKKHHHESSL